MEDKQLGSFAELLVMLIINRKHNASRVEIRRQHDAYLPMVCPGAETGSLRSWSRYL